jgi:hypothetical protein
VASADPRNALFISLRLSCFTDEASCLIVGTYSSSGTTPPEPQCRFYRVTDEERFEMMEYI